MHAFNTHHPQMHLIDGRDVSYFIGQALKDDCSTIYDNSMQTRSFCCGDDVINGITEMINSPAEFICPVSMDNLGDFMAIELAEKFLASIDSKSNLITLPSNGPMQKQPDVRCAKEELVWRSEVSLKAGPREVIHYFCSIVN